MNRRLCPGPTASCRTLDDESTWDVITLPLDVFVSFEDCSFAEAVEDGELSSETSETSVSESSLC